MSPEAFLNAVVSIAVLLLGVAVHESAHGLVARRLGDRSADETGRLSLNPADHIDLFGTLLVPFLLAWSGAHVFGWGRHAPIYLKDARKRRLEGLLVTAAGPLASLLLTGAFVLLALLLEPGVSSHQASQTLIGPLHRIAVTGAVVNVAVAVINLIPLPPMDAFRAVELLAPGRLTPAVRWFARYGFYVLVMAVFTGAIHFVLDRPARLVLALLGQGVS